VLVWSEAWSAEGEKGKTGCLLQHTPAGARLPAARQLYSPAQSSRVLSSRLEEERSDEPPRFRAWIAGRINLENQDKFIALLIKSPIVPEEARGDQSVAHGLQLRSQFIELVSPFHA